MTGSILKERIQSFIESEGGFFRAGIDNTTVYMPLLGQERCDGVIKKYIMFPKESNKINGNALYLQFYL